MYEIFRLRIRNFGEFYLCRDHVWKAFCLWKSILIIYKSLKQKSQLSLGFSFIDISKKFF